MTPMLYLQDRIKWSPLRQEPEAPLNNATSRADRATLRDCACASVQARVTAFLPRQEPGDSKARD